MTKEIKLSESNFCYRTEQADVYHVGNSKIHLFSTLEGFITEETCSKLSKVETTRILLPQPFYQNGKYVGCITKWREKDWIYAFYGSGITLKRNLQAIKEELLYLSELGIDIVEMPFYASYYDKGILSFDGTLKLRESTLPEEELKQRNDIAYQDYIRGLVYSGMSEFETDGDSVARYLYSRNSSPEKRLEKVLESNKIAGRLIQQDIARYRNK